jgi:hypothetical protein
MSVRPSMAGRIGIPEGLKEAGKRVDIKPDDFALLIETKGYRTAWKRAAQCPCVPNNEQTDQAEPNCTLCNGQGWILFQPMGAITDEEIIGTLTDTQRAVLQDSAAIRAVMANFNNANQPWDQITARVEGTAMITVRAENVLGYYDRITNLDATIVFSQILESIAGETLETRYPVVGVNLLRSEDQIFEVDSHFTLEAGVITWREGQEPGAGVRMVAHYLCHPVWRIIEHPHALRLTPVKYKTATPTTPQGDPTPLPVQGLAQYEWLP